MKIYAQMNQFIEIPDTDCWILFSSQSINIWAIQISLGSFFLNSTITKLFFFWWFHQSAEYPWASVAVALALAMYIDLKLCYQIMLEEPDNYFFVLQWLHLMTYRHLNLLLKPITHYHLQQIPPLDRVEWSCSCNLYVHGCCTWTSSGA